MRVVQLVLSATEATSLAWRVAGSLAAPWGRERTLSTETNNSASALVIGKSRLQDDDRGQDGRRATEQRRVASLFGLTQVPQPYVLERSVTRWSLHAGTAP